MATKSLDVFVIGAGVIGLSTAICALEAGFRVTIFAETFPGDKKSIKYTSCWAAANHVSVAATNELLHQLERETLPIFLSLLKEDPLVPVMIRPHKSYSQVYGAKEQEQADHLARCYTDLRVMDPSELPEGVAHGALFSTLCIDVPRYLPYLMDRFMTAGGHAFRVTLPSLSALLSEKNRPALEPFPPTSGPTQPSIFPAAVVNCTGIGALSMGDVMDTNLYPTRGEVLIIRAPWIRDGVALLYSDGHLTYTIPRQSGDVILGGTFQPNDWHPTSRPETVKLIKERGIAAQPELLPADKREAKNIDDLDVVEECVGLRPTRKGGLRIETSFLAVGDKTFPVVHNYGHGGAGYQSSWGSANAAVELLKSVV
ncbi:D-aspartate oxidase [Mycena belliarum]|uniref:D-aspartate oxidase n=1 Tax=Mycena belliarum TaxID=1033014 RepID=A0AAD6U3J5_9AGAR|nr:D-aspartate oxidase [Mycena belliae]